MSADTQPELPREEDVAFAVQMFRMLSDTTRIRLLWALLAGELPVNELADRVGKRAPAVSQHLAKLRMVGMVRTRRSGNQVRYRLANDHVARLVVDAIQNAEHASDDAPAHHRASPAGPPGEGATP